MPTYDYRCKACGKTFEHFQSIKDDPIETCILCGKSGEVDRLISNVGGIIFKGSGFYVTDNKSPSASGSSSESSSGSSTGSSSN